MFEVVVMMVVIFIMIGLIVGMTPYVIRKNVHFGVLIPDQVDQIPDIKKWKKQFFVWVMGLSLLNVVLLVASVFFLNLDENMVGILSVILIFVLVIIQAIVYVYFHHQAKALKQKRCNDDHIRHDARIMVSTDFHNHKIIVSNVWFVGLGGIIILVTALVPVLLYDQIPDHIPRHLNHFNSDRNQLLWMPKSSGIFVILPLIQFAMLMLLMFANYLFKITKQLIVPKHAKRSIKQNLAYRYAMSKLIFVYTISLLLLLAVPQALMVRGTLPSSRDGWLVMGWVVVLFVLLIYTLLKYGQGGERYKLPSGADNSYQLVDDDKFWKWGVLYFNPNDPAIFVEKRFGIGITLNYAKWQAWMFIIGVFIFIGAIIIVTMFLER